jgi:hypothetical protein
VRIAGWLALFLFTGMEAPAQSEQPDAVAVLSNELRAHAPAKWELRVRWRDGQLLASVTPWPYQEAFDLWYNQSKLFDTLTKLCPDPGEEIWKLIAPDQDVILEPTVGGKSIVEARVSCRKAKPARS